MNKKTIISVLFFAGILSLTSCNKGGGNTSSAGGGKTVITFAGRSNENEEANYRAFIDEFQQQNPNIIVNIEWYSNENAYNQALSGRLKKLPDVFMLSDDQFIPYAEGGFLADYREYVDMNELKELVYEYGAEAYCYNTRTDVYGWDASDPDCGFYGYPKDQGPIAIMYNKTLFTSLMDIYNKNVTNPAEQLKLPSQTHPYTYAEFIEVCGKLKDAEGTANFYPCAGYDFDSAIYSNNANYFDESATTQQITSDNFVQAVEFYRNLYSTGCIAPYGGTVVGNESTFISGRNVFYYAGPWKAKDYWKQITSFEWDLIPMCVGPADGAVSTSYIGSMGYVIAERSTVKAEAIELAKFLATNENSQRSQYMRGQAIPNIKTMSQEYIDDKYNLLAGKNPANRACWIDIVDGTGTTKVDENGEEYIDQVTGHYRPGKYTYSSTWRTDLSNWLAGQGTNGKNVWKGEITPRDALEQFASTLQAYLDNMKEQSSL